MIPSIGDTTALVERVCEVGDNIAHDLRSPLNRVRSNLEITLLHPRTETEYRLAIRQAIGDCDELLRTFNALLSIARAEAGPGVAELPIIDLRAVGADAVENYGALAAGDGVAPEFEPGEEPVRARADRQLLTQALCNLLDNALEYAPRGGGVKLRVWSCVQGARVEVTDTGPGIPAAQRAPGCSSVWRAWTRLASPGAARRALDLRPAHRS